jgi:peptide chain release factor 2
MGEPDFWSNQKHAAEVSAEHARATRRVGMFRALERDVDDLGPLAELAEEDPEIAAELEEQFQAVEARLQELEEQRLFAGPYDAGDALVTINAGAGGTDAQDWAEMVLRMEMRWAEKRGFDVELLEASPGEEAGIKSATFRVKGENAYGLYASEKGVHRLVRLSPFDSANRRQTSFAGAACPVGVDLEVVLIDLHALDRVDDGRHLNAGEARLTTVGRVERRQAH